MEENKTEKLLFDILFATVSETEAQETVLQNLTPELISSVYVLAKKHDLAHFIADFLRRNQLDIESPLKQELQRAEILSVYREKQLEYAFCEICEALGGAEISYIPLKGSVIRPYYPKKSLRTSCDIDILIHECDVDKAVKALTERGYTYEKKNYHDVSLYSPNKIHLELHFSILENIDSLDAVLREAWDFAVQTDGCRYDFSREFFVFHMYAHMAYHFLVGGCGIRSLIDIWIMKNKMGADHTDAEELLRRGGIYKFASEISDIAMRLFSPDNRAVLDDFVLKFILGGGVYGSMQNQTAVRKTKDGKAAVYLFKRLFLPYKNMTIIYPVLKKLPFLLPFFWILRWIKAIFGGKRKKISSEISRFNSISDEEISEVREMKSRLGLQ